MNKKIYAAVMKRANGQCEVCRKPASLELHHIIRRRVKETQDNCIALCYECHRGTKGVHGRDGHTLDLDLHRRTQDNYYKQGKAEEEVRELMGGKLYE